MLVRRYEPRDFDDCDWLQRSFYKFPATKEELRGKLENASWVALDQSWSGESEIVGNIITCLHVDGISHKDGNLPFSIVRPYPVIFQKGHPPRKMTTEEMSEDYKERKQQEDRMLSPLIWSIVVAPPYRGNGIGSSLMDVAEKHYKGRSLYLYVEPTNRASQFYKKRGYKQVQVIPGWYGDGSPAMEMVKNL